MPNRYVALRNRQNRVQMRFLKNGKISWAALDNSILSERELIIHTSARSTVSMVTTGARTARESGLINIRWNINALYSWETRIIVFYTSVKVTFTELSRESRGTFTWWYNKSFATIQLSLNVFIIDAAAIILTWTQSNQGAELRGWNVADGDDKHRLNLSIRETIYEIRHQKNQALTGWQQDGICAVVRYSHSVQTSSLRKAFLVPFPKKVCSVVSNATKQNQTPTCDSNCMDGQNGSQKNRHTRANKDKQKMS